MPTHSTRTTTPPSQRERSQRGSEPRLISNPPEPLGENLMSQWALDPKIAFLNHGCFGARTRKVLESQWRRRLEFEARPVEYLDRFRHSHIQRAKKALGEF